MEKINKENGVLQVNPIMAKWLRFVNYFSFPTVYMSQFKHKQSNEPMGVVWTIGKNVGAHMTDSFDFEDKNPEQEYWFRQELPRTAFIKMLIVAIFTR